ncbi:unannotated protein [freshwater metagenome]|uniref:Unannotated protein n=1 Tax=freshwater metagenome TaxID=449393 RepID=A0A6J6DBK0_9ZZZZ
MPGRPTVTRFIFGPVFTNSSIIEINLFGESGYGVFKYGYSIKTLPVSESTEALIPVPPQSTDSVVAFMESKPSIYFD